MKHDSQLCVVGMTRADVLAARAVDRVVPARPALAPLAGPTVGAGAGAVNGVAGAAVLAAALGSAVQAEPAVRALFLALQ